MRLAFYPSMTLMVELTLSFDDATCERRRLGEEKRSESLRTEVPFDRSH